MAAEAIPFRPSEIPASWITVPEAAARSGRSERAIRRDCPRWGCLGRAKLAGHVWYIDPAIAPEYTARPGSAIGTPGMAEFMAHSLDKRNRAWARREAWRAWAKHVHERQRDGGRGESAATREFIILHGAEYAARGVKLSRASLYAWRSVDGALDGPPVRLIDQRGLYTGDPQEPPQEAIEEFKRVYLNENRAHLSTVHRHMCGWCGRRKLWWFRSKATLARWVTRTFSKDVLIHAREGPDARRRKCDPYFEQDPDSFAGGEAFIGDHHQLNIFCWYKARLIRPWLAAWSDWRSRAIVGVCLAPLPNQNSILASLADAVERFGCPKIVFMDRGKDYRSKAIGGAGTDASEWEGVLGMIGIQRRDVLPYSPDSKPIERIFRAVDDDFCRLLPCWCGNSPGDRPSDLERRKREHPESFPTFERIDSDLRPWSFDVYNLTPQQGKYCDGRSPLDVLESTRKTRAVLADPAVVMYFRWRWATQRIGRNGVTVKGIGYADVGGVLRGRQGDGVRVAYDPADVGRVHVFTLKGEFIVEAIAAPLFNRGVTDENIRNAHRERNAYKKAVKKVCERHDLAYASAAEAALRDRAMEPPKSAPPQKAVAVAGGVAEALNADQAPNFRIVRTPIDGQPKRVRGTAPILRQSRRRLRDMFGDDETSFEDRAAEERREAERRRTQEMYDLMGDEPYEPPRRRTLQEMLDAGNAAEARALEDPHESA